MILLPILLLQTPHKMCLQEVLRGFRASVVQDVLLGVQFPLNIQILRGTIMQNNALETTPLQLGGPRTKGCPMFQSVNFIPHHEKRHVPVAEVVQKEELGLCKS